MSGVGEALAILAAVGGLAQAFKQGAELVAEIKRKRRDKGNPPPELLEKSLNLGPKAIEEAASNGINRFGPAFEVGDDRAVNELLQLEVILRRSYTEDLIKAVRSDTFDDFMPTVDTSDETRVRGVTALNNLYMRILSQRNDADRPGPSNVQRSASMPTGGNPISGSPVVRQPRPADPDSDIEPDVTYLPEIGWFKKPLKNKTKRNGEPSMSSPRVTETSKYSNTRPIPGALNGTAPPRASSIAGLEDSNKNPLLHNPWIDSAIPADTRPQTSRSTHRHDRVPLLRVPEARNNYLGFCRGASELQRGDDGALREEREMTFGKATFLMCRYCAFTCRIDRDRIWKSEDQGVSLRYDFLAKSHVNINKEQHHAYLCLFCVLAGKGEPERFHGYDYYFRHLARHRHDDFEERILEKTRCIQGEVADDDEDFDINLHALDKCYT